MQVFCCLRFASLRQFGFRSHSRNTKRTWSATGPKPDVDNRMLSTCGDPWLAVRLPERHVFTCGALDCRLGSYAHCLPNFRKVERSDKGANSYRGGHGPIAVKTMPAHYPVFQAFLQAGEQAGHTRTKSLTTGDGMKFAVRRFLTVRKLSDSEVMAWLGASASTQHHPCSRCRTGIDDMSVVRSRQRA